MQWKHASHITSTGSTLSIFVKVKTFLFFPIRKKCYFETARDELCVNIAFAQNRSDCSEERNIKGSLQKDRYVAKKKKIEGKGRGNLKKYRLKKNISQQIYQMPNWFRLINDFANLVLLWRDAPPLKATFDRCVHVPVSCQVSNSSLTRIRPNKFVPHFPNVVVLERR